MIAAPDQIPGSMRRYCGRATKKVRDESGKMLGYSYAASAEPFEVNTESRFFRRIATLVRVESKSPFLAADQASFKALGYPGAFVAPTMNDQKEWTVAKPTAEQPAPQPAPAAPTAAPKKNLNKEKAEE